MKKRSRVHGESAASETLGAVMLISVIVVAVAIIAAVLTSQGTPQKLPAVSAIISTSDGRISIYHDGGDSLTNDEIQILVDGAQVPFTKGGSTGPWTWSAGDTLVYDMSPATPHNVRVVYRHGAYTIAYSDFAAIGPGPSPTTSTPPVTTPPPAPAVTGIDPASAATGSTVSITSISGNYFVAGATAKLARGGYPDISITGITVNSPTQMTGGSASLAGATAGPWNVVVSNPDGQSGTLANGFVVTNTAPVVGSITPADGVRGTTVTVTDLAGTGFLTGATVRLNRTDSTPIPATGVVVVSPTRITCTLGLPSGSTVGMWDVIVTNPDLQNGTLPNGFAVMAAGPAVTAVSPNSSLQTTPVPVSVAGSGFQSGANLSLKRAGYSDINATGVVLVSSNFVTGTFNLATATPGLWDVVITNPDGQSGTMTEGFTVKNPTPAVIAITPSTGVRGWPVSITNLAGTNFRSGAVVKLVNASAGSDIEATSVVAVSATRITCIFDLTGATAARYNVTVTNPYSDTGVGPNLFTVTSNSPTVTGRSNQTLYRYAWPGYELITGTNFMPGATSVLNTTSGYSIPSVSCEVRSPTQMFCSYSMAGATLSDQYRVAVINPDGRSAVMTSNLVRVRAPPNPTVTSITPNSGQRGTTVTITSIAGTNFQPLATVVFSTSTGGTSNAIYLTNVNVESSTRISGTLVIPSGQAVSTYYVRVTNTDGTTGRSNSRIFSVTN